MPTESTPRTYRARFVLPVEGPPVVDGSVTVAGDTIVHVGPASAATNAVDLGNVALVPGLVNAHTHLEFSKLDAPLGQPGMPLPDWIRLVIDQRGRSNPDPTAAILQGLAESLQSGVTTIGEISTAGWPADRAARYPARVTSFLEIRGLDASLVDGALAAADEHCKSVTGGTTPEVTPSELGNDLSIWQGGISPHAPYTVHPQLWAGAARLSQRTQTPLAVHLAESPEELELLDSAQGPFQRLLEDRGVWNPEAVSGGQRPLDWLQPLEAAYRVLVVHGNYLQADEIEWLAARRERFSVVYCPRTHAYFQHAGYPLEAMLTAGVNLAIGTDSRASNPDLNLLDELRQVVQCCSRVSPAAVLELGTLNGARALGVDHLVGSLLPGKRADLAAVALPAEDADDPYELLFSPTARVVATFCRGRRIDIG